MNFLEVVYRTFLSALTLFLLAKAMGRKQIGELNTFDYIIGITIGSIASEMTVNSDVSLINCIVAMAVLSLIGILISYGTTKSMFLRRGTSLGDLAGLMPGDYRDNKNILRNLTPAQMNDKLQGRVGTFHGFTSTSSIWDKGFVGELEIIFFAPEGTQASSIMSISQFGTREGETLLNAGTKVKVLKIEESDGHKGSRVRAFLEIIPDK